MTRERVETGLWGAGAIGLIGSAVGWVVAPAVFGSAWLAALLLWLAWPVGSLALLLIHRLTGGRWGVAIFPQLTLAIAVAPLLLVAIVPLLLVASSIYGWAQPATAHALGNTRYLNLGFFWGRVGGIVILWVLLCLAAMVVSARWLAGPVLALLLLSVTIVAVDTTLSLEPHFNSTAFGMVIASEWALFALAVATLGAALGGLADSGGLEALAKVLLSILILWGYLVFVQFLIVWNSDVAAEAPWYVRRATHGWGIVAAILFVFHFAVPLGILVWPPAQRSRPALIVACGLLIATEVLRAWWLVVPSAGRGFGWIDVFTMLAALALGAALTLRMPILLARRIAEWRHV